MMKISLTLVCIVVFACLIGCQKQSAARISDEKAAPVAEAESDCSDTTVGPFWPASEKEHRIKKWEIVTSQYTTPRGSKSLILETDLLVATFNIQDVVEQLDEFANEHPNLKDDRALAQRLRQESDARSQFCYSEFLGMEGIRLAFCLAKLLEQGKFIITLRSNGNIVQEIVACEWSNFKGAMDAVGGRVFYLRDGTAFFWTVDWFS